MKRNPNFFRQESPVIKPFSEKFGFYISLDLWKNLNFWIFPRCAFAFKAFFRQGITGKGYYPGLAVPMRFLAALCALNTGSGSPVSGSAISVLFHSFCMWRSVLFSVRSAPDTPISACRYLFHQLLYFVHIFLIDVVCAVNSFRNLV